MKTFLKNTQIFRNADDEILNFLEENSRTIKAKAGELIIRDGCKDTNKIYIIKKGQVEVKMPIKKAYSIKDGEFFWELPFLTNTEKHSWNYVAKTNTELIKINKSIVKKLITNSKTQNPIEQVVMKRIVKNKSLYNK